jgi:hypothetical protein
MSDVTAFLRPLKRQKKSAPAVVVVPEAQASEPSRSRAGSERPVRSRVASLRDSSLDIGVSEQPIDTLPAELQNEFGLTPGLAPGGSRSRVASHPDAAEP